MNNSNEPAYPIIESITENHRDGGYYVNSSKGLTKRERFVMASIDAVANNLRGESEERIKKVASNCNMPNSFSFEELVARQCCMLADALLNELEETNDN